MPSTTAKKQAKTIAHSEAVLPFDAHLRVAMQSVRAALAEVAASVNADTTRPQNLARQLNLDKSLAWHLSKILTEQDAMDTVAHLPGRAGNRIVVKAFEKAGASDSAVEALSAALAEFERMVETHCGDRDTLQMMLGHGHNGEGQAREEVHRRKLFQGASAIWGVKAKAQVAAHFVAPAGNDMLDLAVACGLVDFRRLRTDVPWAVASVRQFTGDGAPQPNEVWEPVDPDLGQSDVPLMRDFCSQPVPDLRSAPGISGSTRYELMEGPVGNTAAVTCMTGWIHRRCVSRFRSDADRFGEFMVHITTPAELFVFDLFVHREAGLLGGDRARIGGPPEMNLYSLLPGGPPYPVGGRDRGRLPLHEPLIDLGGGGLKGIGPPDVILPEFPRYSQAVDMVFTRLGWTAGDFHGYRMKMRYPPIPTLAVFRSTLAERRLP